MYALHILRGAEYTPYVSAAWGRETLFGLAPDRRTPQMWA